MASTRKAAGAAVGALSPGLPPAVQQAAHLTGVALTGQNKIALVRAQIHHLLLAEGPAADFLDLFHNVAVHAAEGAAAVLADPHNSLMTVM